MRSIIREYLASLRERDELDAIFPDLLSELGFVVFSRPSRGTRQFGVDVAAEGPPGDGRVYLFSIKSGDLTRNEWNGASPQALRSSLDEILDAYIPHHLLPEHVGKPIVICPTFGGEIKEAVLGPFKGFMDQRETATVTFEVWNGDRLAQYIENGILGERAMSGSMRSHLRKAIATCDEADVSFQHFCHYVGAALEGLDTQSATGRLSVIRQISVALWMLFVWSRDAGNLESAYLSSERTLLLVWGVAKNDIANVGRGSEPTATIYFELLDLHFRIWDEFLGEKILPHVKFESALSSAVRTSSPLDVNIKLFDILGRIGLRGLWQLWIDKLGHDIDCPSTLGNNGVAAKLADQVCAMMASNGALLSPITDDQVFDLGITFAFLAANGTHFGDQRYLMSELVNRINFCFRTQGRYPCILTDYADLALHPQETTDYMKRVTSGSVLLPTLALLSAGLGDHDAVNKLARLKSDMLQHCTMQFWLPLDDSEDLIWSTAHGHGAALLDIPMTSGAEAMFEYVKRECTGDTPFEKISAVKAGIWPLLLLACRHYRLPVPPQFLLKSMEVARLLQKQIFEPRFVRANKKRMYCTTTHTGWSINILLSEPA